MAGVLNAIAVAADLITDWTLASKLYDGDKTPAPPLGPNVEVKSECLSIELRAKRHSVFWLA